MTTFHTTTDEKEFREIFSLCGTEWAGTATSQQFGDLYTKALLKHAAKGVNPRGFMLRDQKTKELLTCVIVERYKGYFKSVDKSSVLSSNAPPDPSSIGVNSVTFLHVGYVFTEKDQRGKGLAESLIKKAIEYTEKEIIEDEIAKSNPKKKDNFKSMVTNDDNGIDYKLANYYLGKKYFWYLYSAVSTFYERFGFKGYPLEAYKIPLQPNGEAEELLHQILKTGSTAGKKLRFLRRSNKQDLALIEFIFQSKELEILTELNKNISHSELFGSSNSQSSLTNMSDILTMGNLQLGLSLTSISETTTGGSTGVRRKSSVVHQAIPKVAIKPILDIFDSNAEVSIQYASYSATTDNQEAVQFADIQGAVLTNELQNKSYYILWSALMQKKFLILSMGELKSDVFESSLISGAGGGSAPRSRRGSSFSGLNDMGGYNFQDLDILFYVAGHVAKNRKLPDGGEVYVTSNDLPSTIPATVMHDYFLHHLSKLYDNSEVEFLDNVEEELKVLPMLKRFGETSPHFDLDWVSNCMYLWA